jgi:hypothetical protein
MGRRGHGGGTADEGDRAIAVGGDGALLGVIAIVRRWLTSRPDQRLRPLSRFPMAGFRLAS